MRHIPILTFATVLFLAAPPVELHGKTETWKEGFDKTFKGEPAAVIGPYALFSLGRTSSKALLLHTMSDADILRFHKGLADRPARAANWAEARSPLSREVFENALRLQNGELVRADLQGRPEPELFLLVFSWHDDGPSWEALNLVRPVYERTRAAHPGLVEALFLGVKHDATKHARMITECRMPWLFFDLTRQARVTLAAKYTPPQPPSVVVVTREGVLVMGAKDGTKEAIGAVLASFESTLALMLPDNPRTAADRRAYARAVLPFRHAKSSCPPTLVHSPITPEVLKKVGIPSIHAVISVNADSSVGKVAVTNTGATLTDSDIQAIVDALTQSMFVAGVNNGRFVDAEYTLHVEAAQ